MTPSQQSDLLYRIATTIQSAATDCDTAGYIVLRSAAASILVSAKVAEGMK